MHFQADNPGFTTLEENGIWYIRPSGVSDFYPPFFALVTVDGTAITVEFPNTEGGFQGPPTIMP